MIDVGMKVIAGVIIFVLSRFHNILHVDARKRQMMNIRQKLLTFRFKPTSVIIKYMLIIPQHITGRKQPKEPSHGENYDEHWNHLSFKNKNVLDIGADYGSTASYFISLGASKVIAVEGNHKLALHLKKNFEGNNLVICLEQFIRKSEDIDSIMEMYRPDIVKCDIEGWETCLLKAKISLVKEWLIEVHDPITLRLLLKKFRKENFEVRSKPYGHWHFVIQAWRIKS
jgi:hypothetical protein